jgi:hypothetical protein
MRSVKSWRTRRALLLRSGTLRQTKRIRDTWIQQSQPANTCSSLCSTGTQVLGGGGGSYAFAAGRRYDIDYIAEFGSRISNLEINPCIKGDWMPIILEEMYTVVTSSFIAGCLMIALLSRLPARQPSIPSLSTSSPLSTMHVRWVHLSSCLYPSFRISHARRRMARPTVSRMQEMMKLTLPLILV